MFRVANPEEREAENAAQRLMFKVNVILFVGSIVAINVAAKMLAEA